MQLIIFGCLTGGIGLGATLIGSILVALANHLSFSQLNITQADLAKPAYAGVMRGLLIVQFFSLFLLPSLVFAMLADRQPLRFAGLKKPDKARFLWLGILVIVCGYLMVEWLGMLNEEFVRQLMGKSAQQWIEKGESDVGGTLQNILSLNSIGQLLKSIFFVGVLAAIGEELFFRGILQRILIQLFRRPWLGILITAAIFSAVHGQFLGFLPRMVLGILLGYLYWYSGSIYTSMIAHLVFNGIQVLLLYFRVLDFNNSSGGGGPLFSIIGLVALACVAALIYYMSRLSRTQWAEVYPARPKVPGEFPGGPPAERPSQ
jgi:hypothetical protein